MQDVKLFSGQAIKTLFLLLTFFSCQAKPQASPELLLQPSILPSEVPETRVLTEPQAYVWKLPQGFPLPAIPEANPMTIAKVDLGRHLFYENKLSLNENMSCATCHHQDKAFSDGLARSPGVHGDLTTRNSMSLTNVGYQSTLTWANPHLQALEKQMLIPLFGEDPPELGLVGQEELLLQRLADSPLYQTLFAKAFPGQNTPTLHQLTQAIASFERSLVSANSAYDRYQRGEQTAMSASALRGEQLFFSERMECFHCHGGFNFSDSTNHAGSAFLEFNFHNTGLYNLNEKGAYPHPNTGLYELTQRPEDMGKFKAPTLRNIEHTAPYMHDGSIATLDAVLSHYAAGGRTIENGPNAGIGAQNPHKSGFVQGFGLSDQDRADLKAFLMALSDPDFLTNPEFSNPFTTATEKAPD